MVKIIQELFAVQVMRSTSVTNNFPEHYVQVYLKSYEFNGYSR